MHLAVTWGVPTTHFEGLMSKSRLSIALFASTFCAAPLAMAESAMAESGPVRPTIFISNVVVIEGDSGQTPFTATLQLSGWYGPLTVNVTATPGTAGTGDYVFTTTEVTFGGDGGSPTVSGFIVGDINPEGDETFILTATVTSPASASYVYSNGGTVTIKDDDQARASQLHVEGMSVLEGNQGTTTVEVRVVLEPASTSTVTVDYQTQDGTATAGQDYTAATGTLTFVPGETLKTVYVDILGDTLPEPDERFSIVLLQPSMALLGASSGDVMIANDDAVSKAFIVDMVIDEGNDGIKSIPVTVTFDNPASGSSKLQVRLVGATAVADEDFRSYGEILYPPMGAIDMGFMIQVLGDTMPECDEGFYIEYTAIGTGDNVTHRAKVLLRDDDGLVPGCSDPFAAGVPAEIPRDGGLVFVPVPDGSVDLGGSAWPDVQPVPSPDTMPLPSSGTGGSTAGPSVGTGGSTSQPSGFANRSGCSCSFASGERPMGFVLLGLAGVLVASARRRRSRS